MRNEVGAHVRLRFARDDDLVAVASGGLAGHPQDCRLLVVERDIVREEPLERKPPIRIKHVRAPRHVLLQVVSDPEGLDVPLAGFGTFSIGAMQWSDPPKVNIFSFCQSDKE